MLPALTLIAACVLGVALVRDGLARAPIAAVLSLTAPIAFVVAAKYHDRIGFYPWAIVHPIVLRRAIGHEGVVKTWESWGFAGTENDSYLAVDDTDALGSPSGAARWRARNRFPCDVVDAERLWPKLYVVVTYECALDEHRRPQRRAAP